MYIADYYPSIELIEDWEVYLRKNIYETRRFKAGSIFRLEYWQGEKVVRVYLNPLSSVKRSSNTYLSLDEITAKFRFTNSKPNYLKSLVLA
jgi:hypothetical protein